MLFSNEMRILALLHFKQLILINSLTDKQARWKREEKKKLVWDFKSFLKMRWMHMYYDFILFIQPELYKCIIN